MTAELDGYTLGASEESSDGFGVRIYGRCGRPLTDADRQACSDARRRLGDAVCEETALRSLSVKSAAEARLEWFRRQFVRAGLTPVLVEPIPNGYWPTTGAYADVRLGSPWAIVTSEIGRVQIGWRKRVVEIDWSNSLVREDAPTLFPLVTDTKGSNGERYIHAWNDDATVEILSKLAAALPVVGFGREERK